MNHSRSCVRYMAYNIAYSASNMFNLIVREVYYSNSLTINRVKIVEVSADSVYTSSPANPAHMIALEQNSCWSVL